MRLVITGASGFVGQNLVPILDKAGVELLLVSRNAQSISRIFPKINVTSYRNFPEQARSFDMLLHLAVINNDADATEKEFWATNVDFTLEMARLAKQAGIPKFINISSTQALDDENQSPYARTKREAVNQLDNVTGIDITTIYIPLAYGERWGGRVNRLNTLPKTLANALFRALAAFKPTVDVSQLAKFLLTPTKMGWGKEIILSDRQNENVVFQTSKRAIDILFALSVTLFFWWGMILIWALVKLQSPGPGIFAQPRIGRDGKVFTCYKFRTMRQGTAQVGTHEVTADAVTPIGAFLRRTKLDELPQVWNILKNEISLIGPRPCLPSQTELIEARRQRGVLSIKPGISGLAQIYNIDMSNPAVLAQTDARYLALQCLSLDFAILKATALGHGKGDRVRSTGINQEYR